MLLADRKKLAISLIDATLAYIKSSIDFPEKENFLKTFYLQISSNAKGCVGGWRSGAPFVRLSLNDRYFDGNAVMVEARSRAPRQRVWADQTRAAHRGEWMSVEYSNIHNDPEIGKVVSPNPEHHIRMTVLHEIAHAIQAQVQKATNTRTKPHGIEWQAIYRNLRNALLNPLLVDTSEYALAANKTGDTKMATSKKAGKKGAIKKKAAVKKTGSGKGYKGHREGSNKGKAHKIADRASIVKSVFIKEVVALGIKEITAKSWWSEFSK